MSRELHNSILKTFTTPEGQETLEFLRIHCYMKPGPKLSPVHGEEQITFRYGRMTLFQVIEFFMDPNNFKEQPKKVKEKGVFSV